MAPLGFNSFNRLILNNRFDIRNRLLRRLGHDFGSVYISVRNSSDVAPKASKSLYEATCVPLEALRGVKLSEKAAPGQKSCRIFDNPNVVAVLTPGGKETIGERIYRYLDIGGFLSMLNSRKVHLLRTPPEGRIGLMCATELERKQLLIIKAICSLLFFYVCGRYVEHRAHVFDRHPSPEVLVYDFTNNKSKDFTWHGSLFFQYPKGRCRECRWLEWECKKRCYDRLLQEGHEFILQTPMQKPRRQLLPSPYPKYEA